MGTYADLIDEYRVKYLNSKNNAHLPLPTPNGGLASKSVFCIYRINSDDMIKGVVWNAPGSGNHAEQYFFAELYDALTNVQNASNLQRVELVISWSPCHDLCWKTIVDWARPLPMVQWDIWYLDFFRPDLTPYNGTAHQSQPIEQCNITDMALTAMGQANLEINMVTPQTDIAATFH